ncbi:MAG TPA: SIS domain-containing protein [Kofleriaceae bacterium]|nr:SIS domain-containing protein [Kofleriaceae bacterium]
MQSTGGSFFESEIREQPAVLARLVTEQRERVEDAARAIRARSPTFALIAARGSSDNAARYAVYLFGAHNRLVVALAAPSLHTIYRAPPRVDGALVVGISQSGQSPDVREAVEHARRSGALTLAISNDDGSPLAAAAELSLPIGAGEERAVAASKTYTGQLMLLAMLSAALTGDEARWEELAALPAAVAAAVESAEPARNGAVLLTEASRIAVLGRGFNRSTAHEIALKLAETCYVSADPYSWADFLHGPIALVEPGFPIVVVAPSGRTSDDAPEIVAGLRQRGATLVVASDRADLLSGAVVALPLPTGVPEWLSPISAVVAGQLLALALAQARGHDPDHPRGLRKVTLTR